MAVEHHKALLLLCVPGMPTATRTVISTVPSRTPTLRRINDVGGTLTATAMYADAVGPTRLHCPSGCPVVEDTGGQSPVFPKPTSRSVPENYATDGMYGGRRLHLPDVGAVVQPRTPTTTPQLTYSWAAPMRDRSDIARGRPDHGETATELDLRDEEPTW